MDDEQRVIVVGGASGIGRATVELLHAQGARVVVGDFDRAGAEAVASQRDRVTADAVDVSDPEDVERFVAAATATLGGLTAVIHVAGIQIAGRIDALTVADWDRTMAVNGRGPWLTTRAALPALRRNGGGAVVLVASLAAVQGFANVGGYSASKGAVAAFTRSAAVELAGDGIRVNCVCPGWVDTPFNRPTIEEMGGDAVHAELVASTVPLGRQATPAEIAPTLAFLASPASAYTTGQVIVADGGASA
jgi:NAD(P)-dependent dehydrogenase (short-subunit alcohol dehydrogenase family)